MIRLVLLGCLLPVAALAQDVHPRAEARQRFERGLELFEEERYDAALAEFTRAHELAPHWQTLYNIARAHAYLGRPVEAVRFYDQLFAEHEARLPRDVRAEASADRDRQRARIARLEVRSDIAGAIVSIDGVDAGTLPLAPIEVSGGDHVVAVRAPGYDQSSRTVQAAGGTTSTLDFTLRPVGRGVLRIASELPGVEVLVDDRSIGTTPLDATVPVEPGPHVVIGRRPGYREQRVDVAVEIGAERTVELELRIDPGGGARGTLRVRLPNAPARARVDGEGHDPRAPIELPYGPHAVEIDVEEREPWRGIAVVEEGEEIVLSIDLRWTDDARRVRLDAARFASTLGWALAGSGAALAIASAALLGWNETRVAEADAEARMLESCFEQAMGNGDVRDMLCPPRYDDRVIANDALISETLSLRAGFAIGLALTAATGIAGVIVALAAPSEADVDRGASAHLRIGPGGLWLTGAL